MVDSVTVLQQAGSNKKTLAILGDGFTAADQATYNTYVDTEVMKGVFADGYYNEDLAAFNIVRVNLESAQSVVTLRTYDLHGTPNKTSDDTFTDVTHNTALGIISSGEWWHDWFDTDFWTELRIGLAVATWAPGADFILIVVNSPLGGGLRSGNRLKVTTQESASTIAHEFGHGFGNLADEYSATDKGMFTDPEPGRVNVTKATTRASLKWKQFVASSTPVPTGTGKNSEWTSATPKPATWDDIDDAGLFEGANTFETGVSRPAIDCRMRHNSGRFCPVCHTEIKRMMHSSTGHSFRKLLTGRFLDPMQPSVIQLGDREISVYQPAGTGWQHLHSTVDTVAGGWAIRPGDQYHVGDFDGDGRDELLVYNASWWAIPYLVMLKVAPNGTLSVMSRYDSDIRGWGGFAANDKFLIGDLNADGKQDVVIYNLTDWVMPYVATLRSNGSNLAMTRRYDGDIPGWGGLARHDELQLADFGGTGKADLLIWNAQDWADKYLGVFRMTGTTYGVLNFYDNDIPGWGGFAANDRFMVGDFNGDGKDDLYIFNGPDWVNPYLAMFASTGTGFSREQLYDGDVPGWGGMRQHDEFLPADLVGTEKVGLFARNTYDWGHNYAGRMVSNGTGLAADFREDWVGEWRVGAIDQYLVVPAVRRRLTGPFGGVGTTASTTASTALASRTRVRDRIRLVVEGPDRILAHNTDWFGTYQTNIPLRLERLYYRWIHNYRFGRNW